MPLLYHYTSEANLASIMEFRKFDCDAVPPMVKSSEPIGTHLCCTTRTQCAYANSRFPGPVGIVQLDLPTTSFVIIDQCQRYSGVLQRAVYYEVHGACRIEYLVPCAEATLLFDQGRIASIVIDKSTRFEDFMNRKFTRVL